ncbi:XtrA/YqaO family protein [Cytobacillus massiliigabonensis]|uniref:XtrA/YqaO family protein n=1 Tax=Cytobacillus massiliigabonensis TaxID=1871011 RepID=UPI000C85EE16|nr:XtrA/YqaO family protein [Cytobacillus massiliigabonensis]
MKEAARLKTIEINPRTNILEVDIMEQKGSFAIVVCDGKARLIELPIHGETKIITHLGKVKRVKFDEGEEF